MSKTIGGLLKQATAHLSTRGLENPRTDAEYLLAFLMNRSRAFIIAHPEQRVDSQLAARYTDWIAKRGRHVPVQYLTGEQEFYGRSFRVTEAVLIPRPETEFAVEAVLDLLQQHPDFSHAVDIGTGSGCIAVTLACEAPRLSLSATDLSPEALEVARENARTHNCLDRITFLPGRTLEPVIAAGNLVDLVVSNPPYIGYAERDVVAREVLEYEPAGALFAGEDGTEIIGELFSQAPSVLQAEGFLVLEVGYQQALKVKQLGQASGWKHLESRFDLAGIERCLIFRRA